MPLAGMTDTRREAAPAAEQVVPGKDAETAGRSKTINLDALRFAANGRLVTNKTSEVAGFVLVADGTGPQVAVPAHAGAFVACVRPSETTEVSIPLPNWTAPL